MKDRGEKQGVKTVCDQSNAPHFESNEDTQIQALHAALNHCLPIQASIAIRLAVRVGCQVMTLLPYVR